MCSGLRAPDERRPNPNPNAVHLGCSVQFPFRELCAKFRVQELKKKVFTVWDEHDENM